MKLKPLLLGVLSVFLPTVLASPTLNSLARDLERVESVRAVKNVQRQFAQLAQFGRYSEMASLFSTNSSLIWGNTTRSGPRAISNWLYTDAGNMNGVQPGSLDTLVIETPVVSLSVDGKTAKARWNGLRFQGDGQGATRIQGGIYENEYVMTGEGWKISLLRYYALYAGPYKEGWRMIGGPLGLIPYHYTPDSSGVPIPTPEGEAPETKYSAGDLAKRIARLNDEDEVRNLMHAHGFYVDRRMWTDVVDLHASDTEVIVRGFKKYSGLSGVREALERMGPENLTQGINNDHIIFDLIVEVDDSGEKAIARGTEVAMLGNTNDKTASWEFNVFRNHFVKEKGIWKVKTVDTTPIIAADYYQGWGNGGRNPPNSHVPEFLNITVPKTRSPRDSTTALTDLRRRLARSAAFDGAENPSNAYGFYADDIGCANFGALFAKRGHKLSPFAGYWITPQRITDACFASYGTNRSTLRSSISFHWRPQPVILVSEDGRSTTLRARLLQPSTSMTKPGAFNNAIYHDQMVLEDGVWRLWSIEIDEFYWQSSSWEEGWAAATPRNASAPVSNEPSAWTKKFPPDLSIAEVGERGSTFRGSGSPNVITWPDIQRMWFQYRNPVSGRVPEWYWPGCVPCKVRPDWALERNGYQEPADGPAGRNTTAV